MPLPLRRRLAILLATLAVLGGPTLPAAGTPPPDVLTVQGEGGFLTGRSTRAFGPSDGLEVTVGAGDTDGVVVEAGAPEDPVWLFVGAPETSPRLSVGRYRATLLGAGGDARISMTTPGRACNDYSGEVDVLALSRSAEGRLISLAMDYATICEGDPAIRGSLRWNSDVPYRHTAVTPWRAPDTAPGLTVRGTVTLTNAGRLPQAYGRTTWQADVSMGSPQATPAITRDGCAGVTLEPAGTCVVEISVLSDGVRPVAGYLRTPDQTARGAAYSLVTMRAVPAPRPVTLTATPRRAAVRLSASTFNAAYRVLRADGADSEVEVAREVAMPWTDTHVTLGRRYTYRVVPMSGGAVGSPSNRAATGPLPVPTGAEGTFVAVDPVRVLDTRTGMGARRGLLESKKTLRLGLAAAGVVPPSGVSAVLLNVTGTQSDAATYLTVWPSRTQRPPTASLRLEHGRNTSHQVVVPVRAGSEIDLFTSAASTHLVVDVQGYYTDADAPGGGGYHPVTPTSVGDRQSLAAMGSGEELWVPVDAPGVIRTDVSAVEVNVTVTAPTAPGRIIAWDGDGTAPQVTNVSFAPGRFVTNHAIVPVGFRAGQPGIALRNSAGRSQVEVEVLGWYDDDGRASRGLRFKPRTPSRIADSRKTPAIHSERPLLIAGKIMPPAAAHVLRVTATGPPESGFLTLWPGEGDRRWSPTVSVMQGENSSNVTTTVPGSRGQVTVSAPFSVAHAVVDHVGYFY